MTRQARLALATALCLALACASLPKVRPGQAIEAAVLAVSEMCINDPPGPEDPKAVDLCSAFATHPVERDDSPASGDSGPPTGLEPKGEAK